MPQPRAKIGAICFDLFTLFDPRSVETVARSIVGDAAGDFCEAWRARQFQYAFLRAAAGRYADFRQVSEDALVFTAKSRGLAISAADRDRLVGAYSRLEPWPDTRATLSELRAAGLRLAPLANYAPSMLAPLLDGADLRRYFEASISTDAARTYKPDPRAYALGVSVLGLPRERIAFAAFGGWDAAGAKWFGYPTFWVNRLGVASEELAPAPDGSDPTLAELTNFVSSWA
ncbi:MAG TPA: haloacid dehalogenase type II [Candidatus Krumholzibacteria bacterium]